MWFQFYMLLRSLETLLILFNWAPKGSCLSNSSIKLTLIHDDIFALQAIESWSVILGWCRIGLRLFFHAINKVKLSLWAKVIAIHYNNKNVANGVTQLGLQSGL